MMEDLHGDFDNIEEENRKQAASIEEEVQNECLDPENFGEERKAKIHELIEDGLGNDWYTETPEDDDLDCGKVLRACIDGGSKTWIEVATTGKDERMSEKSYFHVEK
ncbi:hypothetical protein Tco_1385332 [Tanacetum coccineum]